MDNWWLGYSPGQTPMHGQASPKKKSMSFKVKRFEKLDGLKPMPDFDSSTQPTEMESPVRSINSGSKPKVGGRLSKDIPSSVFIEDENKDGPITDEIVEVEDEDDTEFPDNETEFTDDASYEEEIIEDEDVEEETVDEEYDEIEVEDGKYAEEQDRKASLYDVKSKEAGNERASQQRRSGRKNEKPSYLEEGYDNWGEATGEKAIPKTKTETNGANYDLRPGTLRGRSFDENTASSGDTPVALSSPVALRGRKKPVYRPNPQEIAKPETAESEKNKTIRGSKTRIPNYSLRPGTVRGKSFEEKPTKRDEPETAKAGNSDTGTSSKTRAPNYSLRPGTIRGKSFEEKPTKREEAERTEPKQSKPRPPNYSLRPGTVRGKSFDDENKNDSPAAFRARKKPTNRATSPETTETEKTETTPNPTAGSPNYDMRPGIVRGRSYETEDDLVSPLPDRGVTKNKVKMPPAFLRSNSVPEKVSGIVRSQSDTKAGKVSARKDLALRPSLRGDKVVTSPGTTWSVKFRQTGLGEKMKSEGNIGKLVENCQEDNTPISPWNVKFRQTGLGEKMKSSRIESPITHITKEVAIEDKIAWTKPDWTKSPNLRVSMRGSKMRIPDLVNLVDDGDGGE